jgi:beta-N-acetylhexosaminidase
VRTLAAGVDLICLGRDQDEQMYLAVRAAITDAVADGRLPAERLEEAGHRVAELRGWLARSRRANGTAGPTVGPDGGPGGGPGVSVAGPGGAGHDLRTGLEAARRALRVFGLSRPLADPVVVELRPQRNIAVGAVPWGLGPWLHDGVYQIDTGPGEDDRAGAIEDVLARAVGRPLVVVVRDAHRHPATRAVTTALLAARPDAVVVEMGLPVWRPASGGYVATYGAARPNGQAAAEALGLTAAQPA